MYPNILAADISQALREFVITGYETTSWPFEGKFKALVSETGDGESFIKGPYVSVQLPFLKEPTANQHFFKRFATANAPYKHQEQAWQRLSNEKKGTIIATGTGSGKTECFMFPLLNHCVEAATKGIKAIVIYPMNALATDQAKRFAQTIAKTPELKTLRVGLFVGDSDGTDQKVMGPESVITCKDTMRRDPPDILLTNYKMLDFLLMRPKDQALWKHNTPETLRYLVVDELHTFDGAQGTDLALLIRRLKAHLSIPSGNLIPVGTSATLGSADAQKLGLADYASQIFDAPFDVHALIGETRLPHSQFVKPASYSMLNFDMSTHELSPPFYTNEADYLRAQARLFFGDDDDSFQLDPDSMTSRIALGEALKQHLFFHNLLLMASQHVAEWSALLPDVKLLPPPLKASSSQVLLSLLSLIAFARGGDYPNQPFVSLRLQLWVRELRRIVASVGDDSAHHPVHLHYADDLKPNEAQLHLPVVQCSECHSTAWLTAEKPDETKILTELKEIYQLFFSNDKATKVLFPVADSAQPPSGEGLVKHLCPECGHLQTASGACGACGHETTLRVFEPNLRKSTKDEDGGNHISIERRCPVCHANNSLILFGSRAASLTSIAIHQLFASHYNHDKKLIAFSDSVQDAAHRAGFYAARTWVHNIRMGMAQTLLKGAPKTDYLTFTKHWLDQLIAQQTSRWNDHQVVAELIAPNLQAHGDYAKFIADQLSDPSYLVGQIKQRLTWEAVQEFGIKSQVGRSLTRTGVAALGWDIERIQRATESLLPAVYNQLGQTLSATQAEHLLWGISLRLMRQGAIFHPVFEGYVNKGGDYYILSRKVLPYMPETGSRSPLPRFLAEKREKGFEALAPTNEYGWYLRWAKFIFGAESLTERGFFANLIKLALQQLADTGLLLEKTSDRGSQVWGLNPEALWITYDLATLSLTHYDHDCDDQQCQSQHEFGQWHIPQDWVEALTGLPSLEMQFTRQQQSIVYQPKAERKENYYRHFYAHGDIERVIAHEHTSLLDRPAREALEKRFKASADKRKPWWENLLSATPTMEMGIDIGDLSAVVMASVPPTQASYLQRMGRAGRSTGNALVMTVANGQPHDLYFYADPKEMMMGTVQPPAIFLGAGMVLRRQLLAYCFDQWGRVNKGKQLIPGSLQVVLDAVEKADTNKFPYTLINHIKANRDALWDGFEAILPKDRRILSEESLARVRLFLMDSLDDEHEPNVEWRLLNRLKELVSERQRLDEQKTKLTREKERLAKLPQDEATKVLVDEIARELAGTSQLKYQLNRRDTLNFFTDEGMLPNYAFPEEGATLNSVIFRRVNNDYQSDIYEYIRPAQAALSELAPNSVFYASNKKVTIERIEIPKGEQLETLQMCPSCHYIQRVGEGPEHTACPKCGDLHWADANQRKAVVKLKQVYASTKLDEALIGDDADNREPLFFNKQMLINFDPEQVELAYALKTDTKPFGFEFIRQAKFTEINFGENHSEQERIFKVAGKELNRPGFKVCKSCGMVQPKRGKAKHMHRCQYKSAPEGEGIIECMYLYREYRSEALRILMPRMAIADDQQQIQSFIAAIQLGLKRRFGGKVDHLQMALSDEPIANSEHRANYIVIYDSVPGGTGYLHELLADPNQLMETLRMARDVMAACACQHRVPEVDGCYQCLFAYRNAYGMEKTSRQTALAMLAEVLDPQLTLERVDQLSGRHKPIWEDSQLEVRFPQAVKRLNDHADFANTSIKLGSDIVRGKKGYLLEVGDQQYTMEMHARLSDKEGAYYPCEPDFLIRPLKSDSGIKPVAVFLDGYEFHHDKVHEDMLKRQGLFLIGQYLVWSLTWHDVESAFAGNETQSQNAIWQHRKNDFNKLIAGLTPKITLKHHDALAQKNALLQLVHLLAHPNSKDWQDMAQLRLLSLMSQQSADKVQQAKLITSMKQSLPNDLLTAVDAWISAPLVAETLDFSNEHNQLRLSLVMDNSFVQSFPNGQLLAWLAVELTTKKTLDSQRIWQKALQLLNWIQFVPLIYAGTVSGTSQGHYNNLRWGNHQQAQIKSSEWDAIYTLADEQVHTLLDAISKSDVSPPQVGYELEDSKGRVIAEAELAWETERVAVVLSETADDMNPIFEQHGWNTFTKTSTIEDLLTALRNNP